MTKESWRLLYLSAFCSVVNYAMLGARELLDVALFATGGDYLLFGNGWARAIIKGFGSDLLLGGGGFIQIVVTRKN